MVQPRYDMQYMVRTSTAIKSYCMVSQRTEVQPSSGCAGWVSEKGSWNGLLQETARTFLFMLLVGCVVGSCCFLRLLYPPSTQSFLTGILAGYATPPEGSKNCKMQNNGVQNPLFAPASQKVQVRISSSFSARLCCRPALHVFFFAEALPFLNVSFSVI